jgi:methylisocitrate lyase
MNNPRKFLRDRVRSGSTVWMAGAQDALTALMVEKAGFDGVFTTGFGISAALLGEPDMELYTLTENVQTVRHIANVVQAPVIADADTGYGNVLNVARTVREMERAGAAGMAIEDQVSPKRCPAAAASVPVVPLADGVARIRAAVDARRDPDFLIIARTDAVDPSEAIDRAAHYAEAGADVVQPISRTFSRFEDLVRLKETSGRRLSLQIMQGMWMTQLSREQIESVAAIANYPLVSLMTIVHAVQENLQALARRRTGQIDGLPQPQVTLAGFKDFIGWHAHEQRQALYETTPPSRTR